MGLSLVVPGLGAPDVERQRRAAIGDAVAIAPLYRRKARVKVVGDDVRR